MPKKSARQKLRAQVRKVNSLRQQEHEQAGITINFELQAMQSVALAHGIMASMLSLKKLLGEDSEQYKKFEEEAQGRIAQCLVQLVQMGIPSDEANQRIIMGH